MAEQEEVKVTCPVCEHEIGVKEDGTKIKVHKIAGVRCDGSDQPAADPEATPMGVDKGDPYVLAESPESDDLWDDESDERGPNDPTDPETPTEPETGTQGVASSTVPEFVHTVTVSHSCPYLADSAWHAENKKMAAKVAGQAGHVLAGAEAEHIETEPAGDVIHVRYAVQVK